MQIIFGASRNELIGSKILQIHMKTDYSHVYVRWYLESQERAIVYQASHGSVHFRSLDNFTKDNIIVREFVLDVTDEQFKKFSQKCIDLAGEKYSSLQLLQIWLSDALGGIVQFSDQSGYICSELMCELLEDLGLKFDKPKFLVKPRDIIDTLTKHLS